MKLEELKKKLYQPEQGKEKEGFSQRIKAPRSFKLKQEREYKQAQKWQAGAKSRKLISLTEKQKKYFKVGGIAMAGLFLIIAGLLIWHGLTSFHQDKVEIKIIGPESLASGEEAVYRVEYKNNNRVSLRNLKIVFSYPQDSLLESGENLIEERSLSDLAAGQSGEAEFSARLIGQKGSIKEVEAELVYQPGEIESVFINQADFKTEITSVPLVLAFDLPEKVVNGQGFNFSVRLINQGKVSFDDLRLSLSYPAGLNLEDIQPQPFEDNNVWEVGRLMPDEEKEIAFKGVLTGQPKEVKAFEAWVEQKQGDDFVVHNRSAKSVNMALSPLYVDIWVNGKKDVAVFTGDTLDYRLVYKNTSEVGINNVAIDVKLEGEAYEMATLRVDQGSFDGRTNLISWRPGTLEELVYLGPGEEEELNFSVDIKEYLPINSFSDKNFTVKAVATIDSLSPPIELRDIKIDGRAQLVAKIGSNLLLSAKGFYYDEQISNSGPIPPKVNQKTTYTIRWQILNSSNDLKDARVEAVLPPHVEWLGRTHPSSANLKYHSDSGKVSWRIEEIGAGTGIVSPVQEAAFQVAITPGQPDIGSFVELLGQSNLAAHDSFTGLDYNVSADLISTYLKHDPNISKNHGIVVD